MSHVTTTSLQLVSLDLFEDGTAAVHLRPRQPLGFTAGQHGLWVVRGGGMKPLTIASSPEEHLITLGTTLNAGSRFKRALGALEPGSTVRFVGPLGGFTLEDTAPSVVMLAQGMGITPFRSMLRHAAITRAGKRTTLVHVGGHHTFRADTAATATEAHYPASREEFARCARDAAREQREATFMVSGSPAFVRSTTALLGGELIAREQIRRDTFYGYSATRSAAVPVSLEV